MIRPTDLLRGKLLIVDDQKADSLLLERILHGAGYESVDCTGNPHEVCELHRRKGYDLILLDLEMPGMDGFQVIDRLKEIETGGYLSVLAITANPDHKLRALGAGAKDFLSKPFEMTEVLLRVHNLLEVRLLHEALVKHSHLLEEQALIDPLTGLANRRLLADRLGMALVHARRNKSTMGVVYLDLDGFKAVNDSMGHASGDLLLKMVSGRLVAAVREEDTVARLGGDEFVISLWCLTDPDYATIAVQRVIEAVSQPYDILGQMVTITTSAGVSIFPIHGSDPDLLMKSADAALYAAKRGGKNTFRLAEGVEPPAGNASAS